MPRRLHRHPRPGDDAVGVQIAKRLGVAALIAAALPLSACSAPPEEQAHVVVQVVPAAHPEAYDVHLAQARAGFRSVFTLRSGQTRTVAVPAGWVTVRVAGLCVVPTPASGTTTVEVGRRHCRVA
jgi:hypothetical protein